MNNNPTNSPDQAASYAGRGGLKLAAALEAWPIPVQGKICADLGSHVGGFVDCLLVHGASQVYAVDTSYGTLAWKLRQDERVVVMERTNALHVAFPEKVDLVTVDVGWTNQRHILPKARKLLKDSGHLLSLLKPQYEADQAVLDRGVVKPEALNHVMETVLKDLDSLGIQVKATLPCPIVGDGRTNQEFWLYIETDGA